MISHFIFFYQFHMLTNEKNQYEPSDLCMLTLLTLTNLLIPAVFITSVFISLINNKTTWKVPLFLAMHCIFPLELILI